MSQQRYWRGLGELAPAGGAGGPGGAGEPARLVQLCAGPGPGDELLALAAGGAVYRARAPAAEAPAAPAWARVPGLQALHAAAAPGELLLVDAAGRLRRAAPPAWEPEELPVREEARCCPHGFRSPGYRVRFRSAAAAEPGRLLVSCDRQLWGSGAMPHVALDSPDLRRVAFFEGRAVHAAALGSDFAAVIARRSARLGARDSDSDEDEEVFASDCARCRSLAGLASPSSLPSLSETCPLGMQVSKSSDDTSSTTAPRTDVRADMHGSTEDSSPSSEESKITKTTTADKLAPSECLKNTDCQNNTEGDDDPKLDKDSSSVTSQSDIEKTNNIFMNTDAARQFLSRQLSWVSAGEDYIVEYAEKPTRIIKENVSNLTNLVYEGVKTVGDKVATLSRHVSGGSENNETVELQDQNDTDEPNSLLLSCTSSYKLAEFQFSNSTIASEKDCDNITNDKANNLVKLGRNILNTDLWTWGDITHGQLGVGDMVKRLKPMLVTSLSGYGLQKVCCGKSHCAVLTLDGRMFCWGGNHYHQVTFESREDRSSPVQFTENSSMDRVRDMIATDDHTIAYTHNENIYYMGKYPNGFTEKVVNLNERVTEVDKNIDNNVEVDKNETENSHLHKRNQNICCHSRILSSGNITYAYLDGTVRSSGLPDLSIAQKMLEEMLLIHHSLNKPFLKKTKAVTSHANVYETVCELFASLLYITALNVLSMWQYTENHINDCEISIIKNCEQYIYLYKKYLVAICDLISISGFSQISSIVDVPSSIYNLFSDRLPSSKQKNNKKTAEAIVGLALTEPLVRLSSYKCIVKSLLRNNTKRDADTEKKLNEVLVLWDSLIEEQEKKKRDAEITKLFWETTGKVIDQFKTPGRRLIRESRSRPLNLVHAGRFTNHWFILLNDGFIHISGSTQNVHPLDTLWVEPVANTDTSQNVIQLITPEESLNVSTSTTQEKTEWIHALQTTIRTFLNKGSYFKTPAVRTASYTFTNKIQFYKDSKYHGRWLDGKLHGHGKVEWPDGKVYVGQFQLNTISGHGKMDIPGVGIYEGQWKDNLQNGYGIMKYSSGDLYEGYFKDGLAHGHGVRRQGDFTTSTATIYMGEWSNGVKQGYGVMDDIGKGEKYLGSWSENKKHGCGLIVTLDGIYYEGVFMQDILTGHGVMVFEDGTHYEGEFRSAGVFSGKGVLTFSSGDKIDGSLNGAWTEGVKISNATLQLNVSNPALPANSKPNSFGKLCVAPHQKWNALFRQCYQSLGIPETLLTPSGNHYSNGSPNKNPVDNKKIWQNVAVVLSSSHKDNKKSSMLMRQKGELEKSVDCLEVIPQFGQKSLDLHSYLELQQYLQKACETSHHPLGQLVYGVTGAFNTTYGGVRVHPLLLSHAVQELKSVTARLYQIVRLLFPALPSDGTDIVLPYKTGKKQSEDDNNPIDGEVVSAASLLQPTLLPRVHPALFVLYALHNKREDDMYWRRLLKWNKQPDITLMAFLGIDQKFWVGYSTRDSNQSPTFSPLKEQLFNDAVETLQQLKTTFSPIEKLLVIRSTFQQMTAAVQQELGESYLWSMDELFPVFHFVVVRARILQLGSEIHFVEDFLEPCMQHGELGIMFTTLKACYFQILQEKMTITS